MKLQIGLNECSNQEYHSDHSYHSSSDYKTILLNIEIFHREKILGQKPERKESTSFEEGSLVHTLILEPHLVEQEYAIFEGMRRAGAQFEEFKAANPGRNIMTRAQFERCKSYVSSFKANPEALKMIKGGFSEQTIVQEWMGVPTKVRCDFINVEQGYIADVKTSSYPVDETSARETVKHWKYDISAALYAAVAEQYYGKPFEFYWIFISKSERECSVYRMSEKTREGGMAKCLKAASKYRHCAKTGLWLEAESKPALKFEVEDI